MEMMEKEWETEPNEHHFRITSPDWMRRKVHRRKRIDKKWLKRYGYHLTPVTVFAFVNRVHFKNLNGYVGLPKGHKYYGVDYMDLDDADISVHGGLTFSRMGNHMLNKGFKGGYWYFGFDTAHFMDYVPGLEEHLAEIRGEEIRPLPKLKDIPMEILQQNPFEFRNTYRNMAYVTGECTALAKQLLLPHPIDPKGREKWIHGL